ncbi:MAG: tRNA (adenine(22)-N(1))-methyltransferase TrmK [Eubacteriales bacterium]|nr:tRNA (adenine(22)-N(1))-methyltransferase TrmK [Eubacteriales bacterium]
MNAALPIGGIGTQETLSPDARHAPRIPKLDARLRAAADWVTPCDTCADIGCDHGRFGAVLLAENRCRQLLAADVSEKALAKAETRLKRLAYRSRTIFAVADGLDALTALPDGRADTICILGMGGESIAGILRHGADRLHGATLIIGAQTELLQVRSAIQQSGYRLVDERVVDADGRQYLLMRALPAPETNPPYTERELLLGPCLLHALPAEWQPWLLRKERLLDAASKAMRAANLARNAGRLAETEAELRYTREALLALARRQEENKIEKEIDQ